MSKIVGFVGYARSGKDTAAQCLIDRGWIRMAFADQLKRDVERCVGCPLSGEGADATAKEFWRPLLVEYGKLRRKQAPEYWIRQLEAHMRMNAGPTDKVCITDVRYPNECHWILSKGGLLIFVDRPKLRPANEEEAQSIQEIWMDNKLVDAMAMAVNDDTIEVLHGDIYGIVEWKLGSV